MRIQYLLRVETAASDEHLHGADIGALPVAKVEQGQQFVGQAAGALVDGVHGGVGQIRGVRNVEYSWWRDSVGKSQRFQLVRFREIGW